LRGLLVPSYVSDKFSDSAPWGSPILLAFSEDGEDYVLIVRGSDGALDRTHKSRWPLEEHWRDIIRTSTDWRSSPEGLSR
jgi:hypothetical protein